MNVITMDDLNLLEERVSDLKSQSGAQRELIRSLEKEKAFLSKKAMFLANKLDEASVVYDEAGEKILELIDGQAEELRNAMQKVDKKLESEDKELTEFREDILRKAGELSKKEILDFKRNFEKSYSRLKENIEHESSYSRKELSNELEELKKEISALKNQEERVTKESKRITNNFLAIEKNITEKMALLERRIDGLNHMRERLREDVEKDISGSMENIQSQLRNKLDEKEVKNFKDFVKNKINDMVIEYEKRFDIVKEDIDYVTRLSTNIRKDYERLEEDIKRKTNNALEKMNDTGERFSADMARIETLEKRINELDSGAHEKDKKISSLEGEINAVSEFQKNEKVKIDNMLESVERTLPSSLSETETQLKNQFTSAIDAQRQELEKIKENVSGIEGEMSKNLSFLKKSQNDLSSIDDFRKLKASIDSMETMMQSTDAAKNDEIKRIFHKLDKLSNSIENMKRENDRRDEKTGNILSCIEKKQTKFMESILEELK